MLMPSLSRIHIKYFSILKALISPAVKQSTWFFQPNLLLTLVTAEPIFTLLHYLLTAIS